MPSLLAGVTPADIRTDPFPHIVVPDILEPALYAALAASFPPPERMAWPMDARTAPNNRRLALPADTLLGVEGMPDIWKQFVRRHSGPQFLAEMAGLFAGHWPPALLAALGGRLTGHETARLSLQETMPAQGIHIRQDARLEINTPVRDRPSSVRGAHLDTPNRLFSGLFYLRAPEDDSAGGELVLYRWRGQPRDCFVQVLPDAAVEEVARIPYRANQLVLFPQNIHALHGVGPRWPTPHFRRYVFITAELNFDWLMPEALGHKLMPEASGHKPTPEASRDKPTPEGKA